MMGAEFEEKIFRRRLMKEVAPGVPVQFSFYSPTVKVQVQWEAEHLPGANGRYVGNGVTIEFVPEDGRPSSECASSCGAGRRTARSRG
jgi:hypothetical protein